MPVSRLELAAPVVREAVLDNGLRVLVQEVHTAPLASVWCWYRVGSKDEGPGLTGVSHWVEHMNFKGTRNIPREQVKGIIEQFGGTWNGYTWIDQTTYLETASNEALDRMLFIEAERMSACLYEPEDCESERTVIISELKGGENDPEQLLDIELTASAFRLHPYRHPTIGWLPRSRDDDAGRSLRALPALLRAVQRDARRRRRRRHRRRRCERIEHHFGGDCRGQPHRRALRSSSRRSRRSVACTCVDRGTTAYWRAAYHAPAFSDPDFLPLLCVDAALTGASGLNIWSGHNVPDARSARRVCIAPRSTRGSPPVIGGALLPTEQPFLYYVSATVADGQTLQAVDDVDAERPGSRRCDGITETGARRRCARNSGRGSSTTATASPTSRTSWAISRRSTAGRPISELIPRLATVTLEQVNDAARRYLQPDNRTIGWFEPGSSSSKFQVQS